MSRPSTCSPSPLATLLLALLGAGPITAQGNAPPAEHHAVPELEQRLAASGHAWLPFLTRPSLSAGLYTLKKGATDGQPVHDEDEVYAVFSGRAKLAVGEAARLRHLDAAPGAVLFVAAGVKHRFVDIEEDLVVLVFFSKVRPTRGGMAAGPVPTEQTPYHEGSERGNARVFYWFGDSSAGQVWLDYGRPQWNAQYASFLTEPTDQRWRFGENAWTSLDTNLPLTIGGVELGVGQYYLVLANDAAHGVHLLALDPNEVRSKRLDAYEANETTGGTVIPLTTQAKGSIASRLTIDFEVDRAHKDHATLAIAFGPHRLGAEVVLKP